MKPLVPYIRQSRAKEKTISLDDQRAAITKWAKDAGVKLAAEVVEQGVSGSKSWKDRELGAAITAVQEGRAAGIIVAFQDRLSREQGSATAQVWETLEAADARLVCACEGLDTDKGDEELNFGFKALMARHNWKRFKKNWADTDAACAEAGVYQGLTPVGFDKIGTGLESKFVKNADAPHVKRAFSMRAGGASYSAIGRMLAAEGVELPTSRHARSKARTAELPEPAPITTWGVTSIRSMLSNAIYRGALTNGEEHTHAGMMIVNPSLWAEVQPREGVKRGPKFETEITYDVKAGIKRTKIALEQAPHGPKQGRQDSGDWAILGGLLQCAGCGKRMAPNANKRALVGGGFAEHRIYVCKRIDCDAKARANAGELETFVTEAAYSYFAQAVELQGGAGIGKGADDEEVGRLEIALNEATKYADELAAEVAKGEQVPVAIITAAGSRVELAKAALEAERGQHRVAVSPEEMRAAFEEADLAGKRSVVKDMLNSITVAGGNRDGSLEDRVELDYRVLIFG